MIKRLEFATELSRSKKVKKGSCEQLAFDLELPSQSLSVELKKHKVNLIDVSQLKKTSIDVLLLVPDVLMGGDVYRFLTKVTSKVIPLGVGVWMANFYSMGEDLSKRKEEIQKVVSLIVKAKRPKVVILMGDGMRGALDPRRTGGAVQNAEVFQIQVDDFICWAMYTITFSHLMSNPECGDILGQAFDKIPSLLAPDDGEVIKEEKNLSKLLKDTMGRDCVFDFETDGLTPDPSKILLMGVSWRDNKGRIQTRYVKRPSLKEVGVWVLTPRRGRRICHNAKYELLWLNLKKRAVVEDTMLRHWWINENEPANLDHLSIRYTGAKPYWVDNPDPSTYASWDQRKLGTYCGRDCIHTLLLWEWQEEQLTSKQKIFMENVIYPMAHLLAKMEHAGVCIDVEGWRKFELQIEKELNKKEIELEQKFPGVNWASPKQVGELLYKKMKIPITERTATGQPSTSAEVISQLSLKYKELAPINAVRNLGSKLGRIIRPIKEKLNGDRFIHTNFNIGLVNTGRLSSSDPNLQNLERNGEEKKYFISRFKGGKLLKADYGQFELRLCAIQARDPVFRKIVLKGGDPHQETADLLNTDRQTGKRINLAMASGISPKGLHYNWGFPLKECQKWHKKWFMEHPAIRRFHDEICKLAERTGYVEDIYGRRRYLPAAQSSDWKKKHRAMNQVKNMPIQGGGANTIYLSMVRIDDELTRRKMKSLLVLQVHDEIVIDCPPDEVKQVRDIVYDIMREPFDGIFLPLDVDIDIGDSLAKGG